jgi:ankyrin repeat protein
MSDFAQIFLIQKIQTYLRLHGREQMAKTLSPGYCAGLTVLFLYLASQSRYDQFKQLLTHLAAWSPEEDKIIADRIQKFKKSPEWNAARNKLDQYLLQFPANNNLSETALFDKAYDNGVLTKQDIEILRQAMLPEDASIEKLFGLIEWIQQNQRYETRESSHYADKVVVNAIHDEHGPHSFENKVYENALLVQYPDLVAVIESCPEKRPIFLGSFDHAFALYKSDGLYYFYDSNYGSIPSPTQSAADVAKQLIRETYNDKVMDKWHPLKLYITSPEATNPNETALLDQTITKISRHHQRNLRAVDGCTAIMLATKNQQSESLAAYIEQGESVNISHGCGLYPIHLASQIEISEMLVKAGANIDEPIKLSDEDLAKLSTNTIATYRSLEGATPLFVQAGWGTPVILDWLLRHHANVNGDSSIGLTPLMNAAKKGKLANVKVLLDNHADTSLVIKKLTLNHSAISGTQDNSAFLSHVCGGLTDNTFEQYNAAMLAAEHLHTDIALELIERGADIHYTTSIGESLITLAAKHGDVRLLAKLIEKGAQLTTTREMGMMGVVTPLYIAARNEHSACVKLLIAQGASVNPQKNSNEIPVMVGACLSTNPEVVKLVLQHGADIDEKFQHKSAILWAIGRSSTAVVSHLIHAGAKIEKNEINVTTLAENNNVDMLKFIMTQFNFTLHEKRKLLKTAIENNSRDCVCVLLNDHAILADLHVSCNRIKQTLELQSNANLSSTLIAHCLLTQKHAIDLSEIKKRIFHMSRSNKQVLDYFMLVREGKPLHDILNGLVMKMSFCKSESRDAWLDAIKVSTSVEELIFNLLQQAKNVHYLDETMSEDLFKFIKEVVYPYPPELFQSREKISPRSPLH